MMRVPKAGSWLLLKIREQPLGKQDFAVAAKFHRSFVKPSWPLAFYCNALVLLAKLRNIGSETMGDAETVDFRKQWVDKIEEQARLQNELVNDNAWEGFYGYRELNDTHSLHLVLPSAKNGDSGFNNLTDRLSREVNIYNTYKTSVVAVNQCFTIAIEALSSSEAKLKKAKTPESNVKAFVDTQLLTCITAIEEARLLLEGRREHYWKHELVAQAEEETKSVLLNFGSQEDLDSVSPEVRAGWELYEKAKYPRNLVRQIDLDTRFQVRVALTLRIYLRADSGISLRTISRLTVLTYICGKLRVPGPDRLFWKPNVKRGGITVGGVDQKLRLAGLK